ncbi:hypothetical protein ERE07_06335 [Allopusillimonas ginsengisoli]|nr:hypothetical protein ERE07_06335 [Allopusillimonas ginsengisoli]
MQSGETLTITGPWFRCSQSSCTWNAISFFLGRSFNYAAAIVDEKGVLHAMDLFATELRRNTAMLGLTRLTDVDAKYLYSVFAYC